MMKKMLISKILKSALLGLKTAVILISDHRLWKLSHDCTFYGHQDPTPPLTLPATATAHTHSPSPLIQFLMSWN